jgi:hypothetical protein
MLHLAQNKFANIADGTIDSYNVQSSSSSFKGNIKE